MVKFCTHRKVKLIKNKVLLTLLSSMLTILKFYFLIQTIPQILFLTVANAKLGVQHISSEHIAQIYHCSPTHYSAQTLCAPS